VGLIAALFVLLIGAVGFNVKYRLFWRRQGVYPVDVQRALAKGGHEIFLINRVDRVTYRLPPYGWLIGPIGIWPRGDIKGVALEDRVKIEDDRYRSKFSDRSVDVSFPGNGTDTTTVAFSTGW
jgi:hypothetical protein